MHSLIAAQSVHRPESSSPSERRMRSFARFISAMLMPLAPAISSIAAAVAKGNGNSASASPPAFAFAASASSSSVTMKPPPIE